jgi:hypothetical protein
MRIELREELLHGEFTYSKHECLIAIIAGTKITLTKNFRHGDLRYFFTIAEDTKLGFAHEHFLAANDTGFPAFYCQAIVR